MLLPPTVYCEVRCVSISVTAISTVAGCWLLLARQPAGENMLWSILWYRWLLLLQSARAELHGRRHKTGYKTKTCRSLVCRSIEPARA